jgi:hypothetical protein
MRKAISNKKVDKINIYFAEHRSDEGKNQNSNIEKFKF